MLFPSKHPPHSLIQRAQQLCHCWKHLLTPSVLNYASAVCNCSWIILMSWHLIPLNANFSSEHQKSWTVLHVDSTEGLSLLEIKWSTDKAGWAGVSLWWRNQAPVHHFAGNSQSKPSCRHHKMCVQMWLTVCPCRKNLWQLAHHTGITFLAFLQCTDGFTPSVWSLSVRGMQPQSYISLPVMTFKRICGSLWHYPWRC